MNTDFTINHAAPGRYTVTHTPTGLQCTFTALQFNDTRQFKQTPKFDALDANTQARILRQLGEFLTTHHPDKVFSLSQIVENYANAARILADSQDGRRVLVENCGPDSVNLLKTTAAKLSKWIQETDAKK